MHAYRSQFAMAPKSQPVLNMEQLRVRLGILHRRVEELETQVEAMPVMATATDVMLVAADLENFLTEKKREIATLKEEFIADTNDRIEALHKAEKAAKKAEKDLWKAQQIGKQQLHEAGQLLHKMQAFSLRCQRNRLCLSKLHLLGLIPNWTRQSLTCITGYKPWMCEIRNVLNQWTLRFTFSERTIYSLRGGDHRAEHGLFQKRSPRLFN